MENKYKIIFAVIVLTTLLMTGVSVIHAEEYEGIPEDIPENYIKQDGTELYAVDMEGNLIGEARPLTLWENFIALFRPQAFSFTDLSSIDQSNPFNTQAICSVEETSIEFAHPIGLDKKLGYGCDVGQHLVFKGISGDYSYPATSPILFEKTWLRTAYADLPNFKDHWTDNYEFTFKVMCLDCTESVPDNYEHACLTFDKTACVQIDDFLCNENTWYDFESVCLTKIEYDEPEPKYECNDGIDNDNDGKIDLADSGCSSSTDNSEAYTPTYECTGSIPSGSTKCANDDSSLTSTLAWASVDSCTSRKCEYTTSTTSLDINFDSATTDKDSYFIGETILVKGVATIKGQATNSVIETSLTDNWYSEITALSITAESELDKGVCGDDITTGVLFTAKDTTISFTLQMTAKVEGNYKLKVISSPFCHSGIELDETFVSFKILPKGTTTECSDGIDNDDDRKVDMEDSGCESASDDDESDSKVTECSDGIDNDKDGEIDLEDSACIFASDISESTPPFKTQCNDGIDNDNDGKIDLADGGCLNVEDDDEGCSHIDTEEHPSGSTGDVCEIEPLTFWEKYFNFKDDPAKAYGLSAGILIVLILIGILIFQTGNKPKRGK